MEIIFLKPIPRPAIWGHNKLKNYFNYVDYPEGIGQSWSFSAQDKEKANIILNGEFKGKTLYDLWCDHQELFKSSHDHFPFIIGLVGPEDNLSIQVHPDSNYAKNHGLLSGKNEAWYFIEADQDADLVYGHNAKNKEDLINYINNNKWNDLIRRIKVKKDDFVYVPAGLLHAMQKNVITYEVQEATDITYRFYDYDRVDQNGNKRELHLNQAIDCMSYDKKLMENHIEPILNHYHNLEEHVYINNESFKIIKLVSKDVANYPVKQYLLLTLIRGKGKVNGINWEIGESCFVPTTIDELQFEGDMEIMITCEGGEKNDYR